MSTQNYQNTDVFSRVWGNLVDMATGHTLELDAGEETTDGVQCWTQPTKVVDKETVRDWTKPAVLADLPADFEDAYLKAADAPTPEPKPVPKADVDTEKSEKPKQ